MVSKTQTTAAVPGKCTQHLVRWLLLILLLGAGLRLVWLGRASLMIDEINVVRDAMAQPGATRIFQQELQRFHWYRCLPMFMVPVQWFGQLLRGEGPLPPDWLSRLPFALLSIAGLGWYYLIGRRLGGEKMGIWALLLAAISPYHIYYSREAYAYAYVIFFSAGVIWAALEILARMPSRNGWPWRYAFGYMLLGSGLLQSHLTSLIFLSLWSVVWPMAAWRMHGWRALFSPYRVLCWLLTLIVPYILFSPFLIRLLSHGYSSTDSPQAVFFSLKSVLAILGRMGWGQAWWALLPFAAVLIFGLHRSLRRDNLPSRVLVLTLLVQAVLYVACQGVYQVISRSMFQVRYFSNVFPMVLILMAVGVAHAWDLRTPGGWKKTTVYAGTGIVLAGLLFTDGLIIALKCRGYNYKGMAQWISKHVPEGGVYVHSSIFEMRGVPNLYPAPGRIGTFTSANSTAEDNQRDPPPQRTAFFFDRFPLAYFVEIAPADILVPDSASWIIPRERLFMRQEWLGDRAWELLVKLKTLPPGDVQINQGNMHKVLFSYNLPEDLPELARKNRRSFYHSFGSGWQYRKEYQAGINRDWMALADAGKLLLGNVLDREQKISLTLSAMVQSGGVELEITGSQGSSFLFTQQLPEGFRDITVAEIVLKPGENHFNVTARPLTPLGRGQFFLFDLKLKPSA
ncbi:MAG: hypothetical protein AB7T27_00360 [Kiritimatiellia bacterium]